MCNANLNEFENSGSKFWLITAMVNLGVEMSDRDWLNLAVEMVGYTNIEDLMNYKNQIDSDRMQALDELAAQAQELEMGYWRSEVNKWISE